MSDESSYPLSWPAAWPRTDAWRRKNALFADRSLAKARDFVLHQLRLMRARQAVISSNVPLRRDGLPRSGQSAPKDPGVAVYFVLYGEPRVLACDKWTLVEDNLWAIGKHIEALRGQQRWGVGTLEQAFAGYAALPAPASDLPWWEVLGIAPSSTRDDVYAAYRDWAKVHHPDVGGDHETWLKIQAAWDQARKEKGW